MYVWHALGWARLLGSFTFHGLIVISWDQTVPGIQDYHQPFGIKGIRIPCCILF